MSSTSVPTPDELISSFIGQPDKIEGVPTYATLAALKDVLQENAASVPCTLGGGNFGYVGMIVSAAAYAAIEPDAPFTIPADPGLHPAIGPNASAAQISERVRTHNENRRIFLEYRNMERALRKLMVDAIDPIYLLSQKHHTMGYNNQSPRQMLATLFDQYGTLSPPELEANDASMKTKWDPSQPVETIIQQIEAARDKADIGGQPYTVPQILNTGYTLVYNSGLYFDELQEWDAKPEQDKTWTNFKTHIVQAQTKLHRQRQATSAQRLGYSAHMQGNKENADPNADKENETIQALANLASATASDRQALAALVQTNADLTSQLKTALDRISALEKNKDNKKPFVRTHNSYCWTHGFRVSATHNSKTCTARKDGHREEATADNIMGGNTWGQKKA